MRRELIEYGYEVARAFRADPKLKDVFLIALSGYAMPEDLRRAAEAGFNRHLSKPVDLDAIEKIIASLPDRYRKKVANAPLYVQAGVPAGRFSQTI